jgi:hypothetical protein
MALIDQGVTHRVIAAQYGVSPARIQQIKRKETWRREHPMSRVGVTKINAIADAIEHNLKDTGNEYVMLVFNASMDKCDFVSSMPTGDALPAIASWLQGMLKSAKLGQASPSERGDH